MVVDDLDSWLQDDWVNRSFDNGVHGHMDGQAGMRKQTKIGGLQALSLQLFD